MKRDLKIAAPDRVTNIDPETDERWDRFVENHPFGWVCHLSGWKRVLESSFPQMKGYYFVILDTAGEKIEAGLPVFHVKSWLLGDRLISIPFATLSDPLVSSHVQFNTIMPKVMKLAKNLRVNRVEIRAFSADSLIEAPHFSRLEHFKLHYLKLNEKTAELLKKFHYSCVTRPIKRSIKQNLELQEVQKENDIKSFYHLHLLTRKRLGLPVQPYKFFYNLWQTFAMTGKIKILLARKDEKIIGAMLYFLYKDRMSNDYAASDIRYKALGPNHFLYWEAIKLAHGRGIKIFDFGRTGILNQGLMNFKGHWGTTVEDLPQYFFPLNGSNITAINESSVKELLFNKICIYAPNFTQELIGRFCYRHLG